MSSGIYQIRNVNDGRIYIGSTQDLEFRKREHFRYLKGGYHANRKLQNAFNKNGMEAFIFEVLEECFADDLISREQYYLDQLDFRNNYNLAIVAGSPMAGRLHTEGSKLNMSINSSGEKNPMYGIPSPMLGKKHTNDIKTKLSKLRSGPGNTMYGKSGALSPTSKKVIVNGIQYDSLTLAGHAIGVGRKVVANRIKSEKYPGYSYA